MTIPFSLPSLARSPHEGRQERRLRWKYVTTTTTFTDVQLWLIDVILVDTTGGSATLNWPPARDMSGHVLYVKKVIAANTVTLDAFGTELIDGALTLAFTTLNQTVVIGAGPTSAAPFTYGWKVL